MVRIICAHVTIISLSIMTTDAFCTEGRRRPLSILQNQKANDAENFLVGAIFGILDKRGKTGKDEDPNKTLAKFPILANGTIHDDVMLAHESLERYLCQWASLLETDKGLSTPIIFSSRQENTTLQHTEEVVVKLDCIRIMFVPPPRYISSSEQRDLEKKGVSPDRKGAKLDSSPGGIKLMLQTTQITNDNEDDIYYLKMVANRYGIDEDTVIKLSSERTIIRRLKEAIRIWVKVRAM